MQCKILMSIIESFPSYIFFPSFGYMIDYSPLCYSMCTNAPYLAIVYRVKNNQKRSAVELLHVALEKVLHVVRALLNYEVFYFFLFHKNFNINLFSKASIN
jgi:hypothetical protein